MLRDRCAPAHPLAAGDGVAALGAAELLDVRPDHRAARWLLHDAVVTIGPVPLDPA
ncbi:hypothetical protein [Dactylosporangium sp. NPDC000521]|uniref:hypothetical protein n=1 Tax=Dactylosporangium sp. NPDC000521 TaxID=3363975 RepID=UPI0036A9CEBE